MPLILSLDLTEIALFRNSDETSGHRDLIIGSQMGPRASRQPPFHDRIMGIRKLTRQIACAASYGRPHPELAAEPAPRPRAAAKTLKTQILGLLSRKHRRLSNFRGIRLWEQNDLTQHHINQAVNACTCLRRCLFPVELLYEAAQGGGAGHGRRKGPGVPSLLDSLHCRVLGGRKTEIGERQHPCRVPVLPSAWSDCHRH
jgi:hypothetical protein